MYFGEESQDETRNGNDMLRNMINPFPFRMELTEAAVSALVDYLYTGEIQVESDINILMNIAIAAHCFQLQECFTIHEVDNDTQCRRSLTGCTASSSAT